MKTGTCFLAFIFSIVAWASGGVAQKFGHFPYSEAPASELVVVGLYRDTGRQVKLRADAAAAFGLLSAAAHTDGVVIVPISGFRSVLYQRNLFARAVRRYGSERAAARWVAPPGHSEHATGLSLDIGDGARREADVQVKFAVTSAGRWLARNAGRFGFELSFPKDNPQGVQYEPWHWRYVGSPAARQVFQKE